jgi:hypothetical protein
LITVEDLFRAQLRLLIAGLCLEEMATVLEEVTGRIGISRIGVLLEDQTCFGVIRTDEHAEHRFKRGHITLPVA